MKQDKTGIKGWAEADRPREKLLNKGLRILTDSELIAILIRSGSPNDSAVDLSKRILKDAGNNLGELGRLAVNDLTKYKGIGKAKAVTIVAALELGRRRKAAGSEKRPRILSSRDAFELIGPVMEDLPHEEFWVILLNRANAVIGHFNVSKGGVSGTVADPKIIFKLALEHLASSVILCHNHPSGNPEPSNADKQLTQKLRQAGDTLDTRVLDHLIISGNAFFSFADEGVL